MPANLENSAVATALEKIIPIPKKSDAKECFNYCTIAHLSYTSKVMLKILQERLQQYVNQELPDVQAGFRKGRGTRDQIANICWVIEKAREFQKKTSNSASFSSVQLLDHVEIFVIPWTATCKASLSICFLSLPH